MNPTRPDESCAGKFAAGSRVCCPPAALLRLHTEAEKGTGTNWIVKRLVLECLQVSTKDQQFDETHDDVLLNSQVTWVQLPTIGKQGVTRTRQQEARQLFPCNCIALALYGQGMPSVLLASSCL